MRYQTGSETGEGWQLILGWVPHSPSCVLPGGSTELLELDINQEIEALKILRSKGKSSGRVWELCNRCNRNPPKIMFVSVLVSGKVYVEWDIELVKPRQMTFRLTQE